MHSIWLRGNALVTFTITVLAVVCAVASLTDFFHASTPKIDIKVLNIDSFQKQNGNDEVRLTMEIAADLESVFTWNTKQLFVFVAAEYSTPKNALNQVSLWDAIITSKDMAKFSIRTRNKYNFVDQGSHLRGKDVNLTMYWNIMPFTGAMFSDQRTVSSVQLPDSYFKSM